MRLRGRDTLRESKDESKDGVEQRRGAKRAKKGGGERSYLPKKEARKERDEVFMETAAKKREGTISFIRESFTIQLSKTVSPHLAFHQTSHAHCR